MFMKISFSKFNSVFKLIRPDNFTYEGLRALYDYLCAMEEDAGTQMEFDVIGLCCEFTQYSNIEEFNEAYSIDANSTEDIKKHTVVIGVDDGSFIIQNF